jgi:hypothetical protein
MEEFNKGVYDPETFYNNENHANQALNAAYSVLNDFGNGYGWTTGIMHFVHGDDLYQTGNASGFNGWGSASDLVFTSTLGEVADMWAGSYAGILRSNIALQAIPNAKAIAVTEATFTDADVNNMMGQAHFLRAYYYYNLFQYFPQDRIILWRTEAKSEAELNKAPAPRDSILNFIVSDLKQAESLLTGFTNVTAGYDKFRASRGAAVALLGKLYMNEGMYAEAAVEFEKILPGIGDPDYGTYTLLDNYRGLFLRTNENNAESIFEVQFDNLTGGAGFGGNDVNWIFQNFTLNRTSWATIWFNFAAPGFKLNEFERWPENIGADPDSTVYDYRAYATLWGVPGGANFTEAGTVKDWYAQGWHNESVIGVAGAHGLRKYALDNTADAPAGLDPLWSDNNVRIIRLGDIYLRYAECMAQLNPSNVTPTDVNSAVYWVDKIRERANRPMIDQAQLLSARAGVYGQLPTATALMAAKGWTLMQLIEHERFVEGFGEGWRKEDLKRWRKGAGYVTGKSGWTGWESLILPLPQSEIDRNPNYQ